MDRAAARMILATAFALAMWCGGAGSAASADGPQYETSRHASAGYARNIYRQRTAAYHESARTLGRIGFRYENGFGVPQSYDVAADYYARGAEEGDAFAQSRLGLSYDRGHGVPQNFVLSYKWLNIAAARAVGSERNFYLRLRDAVAQKMSLDQVVEGQQLALQWAASRY